MQGKNGIKKLYRYFFAALLFLSIALANSKTKGAIERSGGLLRRTIWQNYGKISNYWLSSRQEKRTDSAQTAKLRRKLAVLEVKIKQLTQENNALRKQLEAPLPADLKMLPARVIGVNRFLFIDQGRQTGVKQGQAVISEEILVGRVIAVGEQTAKVRLLGDKESRLAVRTSRGALGLLLGNADDGTKANALRLTKVLQRDQLDNGDFVLTAGGGPLPAGILVGKITAQAKTGEVYQTAAVKREIDARKLLEVFVVLK